MGPGGMRELLWALATSSAGVLVCALISQAQPPTPHQMRGVDWTSWVAVGRSRRVASCAPISQPCASGVTITDLRGGLLIPPGYDHRCERWKSIRRCLDHGDLGAQGGQPCALADAGVLLVCTYYMVRLALWDTQLQFH